MNVPKLRRRSFMGTLAAMGLLGATGTAGASSSGQSPAARGVPTGSSAEIDRQFLGVELVDLETGARQLYERPSDVDRDELSAGIYEVVEVTREGQRIDERRRRFTVSDREIEPSVDDGIDLRVLAGTTATASTYRSFEPDDTVTVLAGAVERTGGIDRSPVEDVELDVRLQDPDGTTTDTAIATTNEQGNATVTFDLEDADHGSHSIVVESDATDATARASFGVGPYVGVPFHWTGMTTGEETTIGVYSRFGEEPDSDITRAMDISGPDGFDSTVDVEIEEGGIGLLPFTPEAAGSYRFESIDSITFGDSIGSGELKALAPYFEVRDQYAGETVTWGAHVVDEKEPVPNLDLEVTLNERFADDEIIDQFTATTNEFGQFTIEFDAPPDTDTDYQIDIETADGRSVFLFGDRIRFNEPPEATPPDPVQLTVSIDDFTVAPGSETTIDVSLSEGGSPVVGETVSLLFDYTFDDVPAGTAEIETDADGTAQYSFAVPDDAPDGERFYVTALVELDGELHRSSSSSSIEKYSIDMDTWGLSRGTTNTIDVTATDQATDEPAPGIDITIFGNRYNVDTETFDAGYTQTDASGEGAVELTVPADVTNDIMTNELTPYRSSSISGGSIEAPFQADITVSPQNPAPGDTITVSYTTDIDEPVSAIAVFPSRDGADVTIIEEGDEGTLEVPSRLEPGSWESLELLLLAANGEAAEDRTSVSLAEELTASFVFDPADPSVGEAVSFEDTSSPSPDAAIADREWDLTGDGQADATGESATFTYEEAGDYEVTLTVTDEEGSTDDTTRTVSVSGPDEEKTVEDYADDDGTVSATGVLEAFADWQAGEIDATLVLEVFSAWQSGEEVA